MSKQSCAALLNPASMGGQDDGCNYCHKPLLISTTEFHLNCISVAVVSVSTMETLGSRQCCIHSSFVTHGEVRSVPISLCKPAPVSLYSGHGGFCSLRWLLLAVTGRLLHFGEKFMGKSSARRPLSCQGRQRRRKMVCVACGEYEGSFED